MTKIFSGFTNVGGQLKGAALAIGNFDGMHLGHQVLVARTHERARKLNTQSAILTFSPHPTRVLRPEILAPMICTESQRLALLKAGGVDAVVVQPFSREFSVLSPQQFISDVLVQELQVGAVVVGQNFRFGHRAQGNADMLKDELPRVGVEVDVVAPVMVDGEICSSTQIPHFVRAGQLRNAARLLGRWYVIEGIVVPGAGHGRSIGIRTINVKTENELLPAVGVYATWVRLNGELELKMGATNVGYRPTFDEQNKLVIETHILDFSGELYGADVEILFVEKLRDEKKFASVEELVQEIQTDISKARLVLSLEMPA